MENKIEYKTNVTLKKEDFLNIIESVKSEENLIDNGELMYVSSFEADGIIYDEIEYIGTNYSYLKQRTFPVKEKEFFDFQKVLDNQKFHIAPKVKPLDLKITKKQKETLVKGMLLASITAFSFNTVKNTYLNHVSEKEEINILVENLVSTQGKYLTNNALKGTETNYTNNGKSASYLNVYDHHMMAEKIVLAVVNNELKTIDDVYVSLYSIYQALNSDAFLDKKGLIDNVVLSINLMKPDNTILDLMPTTFDEFLISIDCLSEETAITNTKYKDFMDNMLLEMSHNNTIDQGKIR